MIGFQRLTGAWTKAAATACDTSTLLDARNLSLAYGNSQVVHDVSLKAERGSVVCVMGRNGAGKTTLLKSIMGVMPSRRGKIQFQSGDVTRAPAYRRARLGMGYVPQGRGIFPYLSVIENLQMGLESTGGKDTGQLDEVYDLFPVLAMMRGRVAGVLSGGQQQQLAIGRALMGRPELLILDEPTEGIQPSIVGEIEEVVASLRSRMTILLVEQFLDFALATADYCYVMENGVFTEKGKPSELNMDRVQEALSV